jgi:hypothetical protein
MTTTHAESYDIARSSLGFVSPNDLSLTSGENITAIDPVAYNDSDYAIIRSAKQTGTHIHHSEGFNLGVGEAINGSSSFTTSLDNLSHDIKESNSSGYNDLDVYYAFSVLGGLQSFSITAYSKAESTSENFDALIYNWVSESWDFLVKITAHESFNTFNVSVSGKDGAWISSSGLVYLRYRDTISETGNGNLDTLRIDYHEIFTREYRYDLNYSMEVVIPQNMNSITDLYVCYDGYLTDSMDSFGLFAYNYSSGGYDYLFNVNQTAECGYNYSVEHSFYVSGNATMMVSFWGYLSSYEDVNVDHYIDRLSIYYTETYPQYSDISDQLDNYYHEGRAFRFNCTWRDNTELSFVYFEINSGQYGVNVHYGSEYVFDIELLPDNYSYRWGAVDPFGNENWTGYYDYSVIDKNPPTIENVSIDFPFTNVNYYHEPQVGADVFEPEYECGIRRVIALYGTESGVYTHSVNMVDNDNDSRYTGTLSSFETGTIVWYIVSATDNFNNTANSSEYSYVVVDEVEPELANISRSPSGAVQTDQMVTIRADIIDVGSDVDYAWLEYGVCDSNVIQMVWSGGGYEATVPEYFSNATLVRYRACANDTSGNIVVGEWLNYTTNVEIIIAITDNHGIVVSEANIELSMVGSSYSIESQTDIGGIVCFDVPNGEYIVEIWGDHYLPSYLDVTFDRDLGLGYQLEIERYSLDIRLVKAWNQSEFVDGATLTAVNIDYSGIFGSKLTDGNITQFLALENGSYLVQARKVGYDDLDIIIDVTNNDTITIVFYNDKPEITTNLGSGSVYSDVVPIRVNATDSNGISSLRIYVNDVLVYSSGYSPSVSVDISQCGLEDGDVCVRIVVEDGEGNSEERHYTMQIVNNYIGDIPFIVLSFIVSPLGLVMVILAIVLGLILSFYNKMFRAFFITSGIVIVIAILSIVLIYSLAFDIHYLIQVIVVNALFEMGFCVGFAIGSISRRTILAKRLRDRRDSCLKDGNSAVCKYLFSSKIEETVIVYNRPKRKNVKRKSDAFDDALRKILKKD